MAEPAPPHPPTPTRSPQGTRRLAVGSRSALLLAGVLLCACAHSVPLPVDERAAAVEREALEAYADLPLDTLRFLGTHNSYHRSPRLFGIPFLPIAFSGSHRYTQPPLPVQLDGLPDGSRAVRQFEIDIHMRRFDDQLRVFHLPWIDNRSNCKTLEKCLQQMRAWSDARGGDHAPILVWLEPKDETPLDRWITLGWYEHVDLEKVEEVILRVIPRERIFTPDDLRRGEATLPGAIAAYGWPKLGEMRGRFMFALLDQSEHREAYVSRTTERNLAGQLMFVRATAVDEPWAAMFKVNNAVPTLRDMQAFGREALADPELAALQVYPPPPEEVGPPGPFRTFFQNLWTSMQMDRAEQAARSGAAGDGSVEGAEEGAWEAGPAAPDEAGATDPERPARGASDREGEWRDRPDASDDAAMQGGAEAPDPVPPVFEEVEVTRAVHRELEAVHPDTPPDEKLQHRAAVEALEDETLVTHAPESEELAIVLRNADQSRAYRELLVARLRDFLEAQERARILQLAAEGFLVTTTADDLKRARKVNRERAASAFFSAAQYISTDALVPQGRRGYVMPFSGRPFSCNSFLAHEGCAAARSRAGSSPSTP